MTTIHAYTATQKTVDGPSGKVCCNNNNDDNNYSMSTRWI